MQEYTHTHTHTIYSYKNKLEKGITLVALVITIIILLILAGITLASLSGENGILRRAGEAKERYGYSNAEEKVKLAVMEYYTNLKEKTMYSILSNIQGLESIEPDESEGMPYEIVVDGYIFLVKEDEETKEIEIEYRGESKGIVPQISVEKTNINDKEAKITAKVKTEDKEGIEKLILVKNGVEIEVKQVNGKDIIEDFTVTGNGIYKIIAVGKNKRRVVSEEIHVEGLINMSGTLKIGTVVDGEVTITLNGTIGEGNIQQVEIYDNKNEKIGETKFEGKNSNIEEQYKVELPFYEQKSYFAKMIADTGEEEKVISTQTVMNSNSIRTSTDVKKLSSLVGEGNSFRGSTIKLINDIDMKNEQCASTKSEENTFEGTFDGQFKTITRFKSIGRFL